MGCNGQGQGQGQGQGRRSLLLLVITDGEATNMRTFSCMLDQIQNQAWGGVQVCLLGLSLQPDDIAFFENEECEGTRIRTIEPLEVEQQQMLLRQVIAKEGDYNFAMHTYRALVINFFPV